MPQTRLNARVGQIVTLDATFYSNGIPTDPYAIRRIDIYADSVKEENLLAQVPISDPTDTNYPSPLTQVEDCPGYYQLAFEVPCDFPTCKMYFDVWRFIGEEDGCVIGSGSELDLDDETKWQSEPNQFWVFAESYYLDDGLVTPRFGFEPLDFKLRKGEVRTIEIGIQPLPLYDFDFNRIAPLLPQMIPAIRIETDQNELIVDWTNGKMGLRQGSFRSNPFVAQFTLDTNNFLIGTYTYRVRLALPNGESRISQDLRFSVQ